MPGSVRSGLLSIALSVCFAELASAQSDNQAEIDVLRAEILRLTERLDRLETQTQQVPTSVTSEEVVQVEAEPDGDQTSSDIILSPPLQALIKVAGPVDKDGSRVIVPATADRALQGNGSGFELNASTEESTVSIKLSRRLSSTDPKDRLARNSTFSLIASAPLSTTSQFSDVISIDSFVNSSRLRFQWSTYNRTVSSPVDDHPRLFNEIKNLAIDRCKKQTKSASHKGVCEKDIISDGFVSDYRPDLADAFDSLLKLKPRTASEIDWSARAFGLEGSIGYKAFEYLDEETGLKEETDKAPLSAKAFASYLPDIRKNSITSALEYQYGFQNNPTGSICPANLDGAQLTCLVGAIGNPKLTEKLLWSLEYRQLTDLGADSLIPGFAISPKITFDTINDDVRFDLPIHLIGADSSRLSGGVRFGFDTTSDDFIAGVFVSQPFSLR